MHRLLVVGFSVILVFRATVSTICPQPDIPVTQNTDGTWARPVQTIPLEVCFTTREWYEEWTERPDKQGSMIRTISKHCISQDSNGRFTYHHLRGGCPVGEKVVLP